jgi:exonuclease III
MRIIEWNSQGAFRKKNDKILSLRPDILIVSECESETKLRFGDLTPKPNDFFWTGDSENKGIGIFSFSDYRFEILKSYNPSFRHIIPLKVTGQDSSFLLFAIWAMDNKENPDARYIGQIWLAINYYSKLLSLPCILTGDFNSNKIWDFKERVGNHSNVVDFLEAKNVYSLYHKQTTENHGEETTPTFHMYRKINKPYHIDYCFASDSIISQGFKISIENISNWSDLSDHVPMIVDLNAKPIIADFDDIFSNFLIDKINELSVEIKTRFSDKIDEIKKQAKTFDKSDNVKDNFDLRKLVVDKYENLLKIDKLIKKLNNAC